MTDREESKLFMERSEGADDTDLLKLEISEEQAGVRIDRFLAETVSDLTRSYAQTLLSEGNILVNGKTVKPNYKLRSQDLVILSIPEPEEPAILPENIPLDIVYEDPDVLVVNKPKGMVVHPAVGHYSGTLVNAILYHCGNDLSSINGVLRPGIVHRIDMDTTGLLVVCKNNEAHQSLSQQLREHSITRKYQAVVYGNIKEDEGTINQPIGRHPIDRKKQTVDRQKGKEAITHYRVLERFQGAYTFLECQLETGRTHQIRVHMAYIQHPLVGDTVYGPAKQPFHHLQGQTLHAGVLGFVHPKTGEYMEFHADLPEYFQQMIHMLRERS